MNAEAQERFASCSDGTRRIIERWRRDLEFTAPEAGDWRWSLIAAELDGFVVDRAKADALAEAVKKYIPTDRDWQAWNNQDGNRWPELREALAVYEQEQRDKKIASLHHEQEQKP